MTKEQPKRRPWSSGPTPLQIEILKVVHDLGAQAYNLAITRELNRRHDTSVNHGQIYLALRSLVKRKLLVGRQQAVETADGSRRKVQVFELNGHGKDALGLKAKTTSSTRKAKEGRTASIRIRPA